MALLLSVLFLFLLYTILIMFYWQGWRKIPLITGPVPVSSIRISVIIPARNEASNIGRLLKTLETQSYPRHLYEVIVVDDHSEDETAAIVRQFANVRLLQLTEEQLNSYKKKAIETGIASATNELIVTTDADCLPGTEWLATIAACKERNAAVFIAAPVTIACSRNTLLSVFEQLDFMVLQGITGASVYTHTHSMCNGANLAYERNVFYEVNGFAGIDAIASGDDMLLMHKIWKHYPQQVYYLKSTQAMVATQAAQGWRAFLNQRIRWASKAYTYDDKRIMAALVLVYLINLAFLVLFIAAFFVPQYWLYLAGFWMAKTLVEFPFVYSIAGFFGKKSLLKYFFFFQPLHIGYIIASGFFGQLGKYEWKGRKVK